MYIINYYSIINNIFRSVYGRQQLLALAMIAIQYFMLDVLQYTRQMAEQQKEGFINIYPIINNLL